MLRISDARNFGRTLTGLLLFAAPAAFLIATAIQPSTDHKNKLQELNAVAAHKGMYLAGGLVLLLGSVLMIAMGIGIMRLFRGARGVTLGQLAGALLTLGSAMTIGWYTLGAAEYEMVNHSGLDRQALAAYLHASDQPGVLFPIFIVFMVGIVVGTILLAIANWRTRVAPVWASVLIVLGGVPGAFGDSRALSIVTFALLLAGLGALGARVLAMSDEEWDAPRQRAREAPAGPPEPASAPAG